MYSVLKSHVSRKLQREKIRPQAPDFVDIMGERQE